MIVLNQNNFISVTVLCSYIGAAKAMISLLRGTRERSAYEELHQVYVATTTMVKDSYNPSYEKLAKTWQYKELSRYRDCCFA